MGTNRTQRYAHLDGNEAAARIAYKLSEVIAIYPITPASPMGELSDGWSAAERTNLWGAVPEVIEMQSEGGAAGAVHGALQKGALATTFTASQGLLLMLPNMFKIAGELSPCVIHVAARTVATHALSIFGDHSDVMAARTTGFAMLASSSVQEAQDHALIAHAVSLETRVPFLHFFDGFRTSHEINQIDLIGDADIARMIDQDAVLAHRFRGLTPDHPVLRGSAQNPDVYFQAREACNPFYDAVPDAVRRAMKKLGDITGRSFAPVTYFGDPEAERIVIAMGSGLGAIREAVDEINDHGEKVGAIGISLYRPFPVEDFIAALPDSVRSIAVLDRTKEPGAIGDPLYLDVATALREGRREVGTLIGGRYGLSSKEFTPSMVAGVFRELSREVPLNHFTVGIVDDVTKKSLAQVPLDTDKAKTRAVFFGLGSDGTVSANKNSVKIVGAKTPLWAQGYFVYDSKKSGSTTTSHLRFDDAPITSTYLIQRANFLAIHSLRLLDRIDCLAVAEDGATLLLNSPFPAEKTWDNLPARAQEQIRARSLRVFTIDASSLARELGLANRINTIMQTCFFALTDLVDLDVARAAMKESVRKEYGKRGTEIVERNEAAIDAAVRSLESLSVPTGGSSGHRIWELPDEAPDFVQRVTAKMLAGEGDLLPVSALPVDGTFPTGTSKWEKRAIADEIPIWDPSVCIDCAHCVIVCPHAALRMKVFEPGALDGAPSAFRSKDFRSKELNGMALTIQVSPEDCTACGICVDVCPATSKTDRSQKALNMDAIGPHLSEENESFTFFEDIPELDKELLDPTTVKGSQARTPYFEYSGACSGCGETPYLKLLTQLYGDRLLIANATGCSSIFGGNLPTTPWTVDADGRGPAWANSLFEDNAEFGLGIRVALDHQVDVARATLERLAPEVGQLAPEILGAEQSTDAGIALQRGRVKELREKLASVDSIDARTLTGVADDLVDKQVWIVGGDGWAYDIGSSGLDHVLASGRNVNVLVLDTEVYSNTGGQASKATPRGAVAKFAARGKPSGKKDLGMIATSYGNVYVAQIALGANYAQTIKALNEAAAWPGPSLVIAYGTCIAHGIEMSCSMTHQKDAVKSGYWSLYRYHPGAGEHEHPFTLDSPAPSIPVSEFASTETRFMQLKRSDPERAEHLMQLVQRDVDERRRLYSQLAGVERSTP